MLKCFSIHIVAYGNSEIIEKVGKVSSANIHQYLPERRKYSTNRRHVDEWGRKEKDGRVLGEVKTDIQGQRGFVQYIIRYEYYLNQDELLLLDLENTVDATFPIL